MLDRRLMRAAVLWTVLLAGVLVLLAACVPEDKVSWSSDGSRALVIAGDGLRLMQPDGTLSEVLLPDVSRASWIGTDNVLLARTVSVKSWQQAGDVLTPDDQKTARHLGDYLLLRLKNATGSPEQLHEALGNDPVFTTAPALLGFAGLYALSVDPTFAAKLGNKPDEVDAGATELLVAKIADGRLTVLRRLTVGGPISDAQVNAVHGQVLFTEQRLGAKTWSLGVVPLEGGATEWIAENVAPRADWTADGTSALYIDGLTSTDEKHRDLGALVRQKVLDPAGQLLPEAQRQSDPLADVAVSPFSAVRGLADGRVLFTSPAATLPSKPTDQRQMLYVLTPTSGELAAFGTPGPKDSITAFAVSPDGHSVAALLADERVAVANIDGPGPYRLQPLRDKVVGTMVPAWRRDEVTFIEKPDAAAELVRMAPGEKATELSTDWPEPARRTLLDQPEGPPTSAATQPATRP